MNPNKRTDGTIQGLREFYGRNFQEYAPGKVYEPFYERSGGCTCANPIIIGYIKTGKLAWMEQWIEVCQCETGKWGWACTTASDSCEGHNNASGSSFCFVHIPHPNYTSYYCYDSAEDAIKGAIAHISKNLDERGDRDNKGTRKMLALALSQLKPKAPEVIQLSLF